MDKKCNLFIKSTIRVANIFSSSLFIKVRSILFCIFLLTKFNKFVKRLNFIYYLKDHDL